MKALCEVPKPGFPPEIHNLKTYGEIEAASDAIMKLHFTEDIDVQYTFIALCAIDVQ